VNWTSLENALAAAVNKRVTPGGQLVIGHRGQVVHVHPFGYLTPQGSPVSVDSVFDIASLTKPFTALAALTLVGEKQLRLSDPVGSFSRVSSILRTAQVRHLLGHAAGLPAHKPFFEQLLATPGPSQARRNLLDELIFRTPLLAAPGEKATYTDLGYILLGSILERVTGDRLDHLVHRVLTEPLGLTATRFVDLDATPRFEFPEGSIAPTEICPRRGLLTGQVHDENCHAAGGICGHAGLFSTAGDLSLLAQEVLRAWHGRGTVLRGHLARDFAGESAAPNTSWRLGWDTPSTTPGVSHAGDLWPRDGFGHLGFTGCSLWLAPRTESWVVLLTNRVHPTRDGEGIRELRREVMDSASRFLSKDDPLFRV